MRFALCLLPCLLLGCSSKPEPQTAETATPVQTSPEIESPTNVEPPAEPVAPAPEPAIDAGSSADDCFKECMAASQQRAMSIEQIELDCRKSCQGQ